MFSYYDDDGGDSCRSVDKITMVVVSVVGRQMVLTPSTSMV